VVLQEHLGLQEHLVRLVQRVHLELLVRLVRQVRLG
jgi:hypothetical protein